MIKQEELILMSFSKKDFSKGDFSKEDFPMEDSDSPMEGLDSPMEEDLESIYKIFWETKAFSSKVVIQGEDFIGGIQEDISNTISKDILAIEGDNREKNKGILENQDKELTRSALGDSQEQTTSSDNAKPF